MAPWVWTVRDEAMQQFDPEHFYSADAFLSVVADAYFPCQRTEVREVLFQGRAYRLLLVDDAFFLTEPRFLDYHVPLPTLAKALPDARLVHLPNTVVATVPADDIDPALRTTIACAPFVSWSRFDSFDAYLAFTRDGNKSLMKETERRHRQLEREVGSVEFRFDDPDPDVLPFAAKWKGQQLMASGATDMFEDEGTWRFLRAMRDRPEFLASTIRIDGRLLATWLGYVHDGVLSGWVFTFDQDPALKKYSLGHRLLRDMLRESHARGHRRFDFSIGGETYKWLYATDAHLLAEFGQERLRQIIGRRLRTGLKKTVGQLASLARPGGRAA
jgi:CelD/BcsL family acetyltransferase involved in cellulose biosynthesis